MPAILTHYLFGMDALEAVSSVVGFTSCNEHEAFLLGNQGPDPLFYLAADPFVSRACRKLGHQMHHESPAHLLCALHDSIDMLPPKQRLIGEAYAAGFLCHYLLDSMTHPYILYEVNALCNAGVRGLDRTNASLVHQEIERDLDEALLYAKTSKTIAYGPVWCQALQATDETLAIIDKMYFHIGLWTYGHVLSHNVYTQAVRLHRLAQWLFWSPSGIKAHEIIILERLLTHKRYSRYGVMSHHARAEATSDFDNRKHYAWTNPFTGEVRRESFKDLYKAALAQVYSTEQAFFISDFGLKEAQELTQERNFVGKLTRDRRFFAI